MLDANAKFDPYDGTPEIALLQSWESALTKYSVFNDTRSKKLLEPVGSKKPNPWGLYDMYGNVWELVQDAYAPYPEGPATDPCQTKGRDRIFRGGSFQSGCYFARSANRRKSSEAKENESCVGVRLARTPRQ
jgi:formylglycine-generating enzyme required for sulfatase activity